MLFLDGVYVVDNEQPVFRHVPAPRPQGEGTFATPTEKSEEILRLTAIWFDTGCDNHG